MIFSHIGTHGVMLEILNMCGILLCSFEKRQLSKLKGIRKKTGSRMNVHEMERHLNYCTTQANNSAKIYNKGKACCTS